MEFKTTCEAEPCHQANPEIVRLRKGLVTLLKSYDLDSCKEDKEGLQLIIDAILDNIDIVVPRLIAVNDVQFIEFNIKGVEYRVGNEEFFFSKSTKIKNKYLELEKKVGLVISDLSEAEYRLLLDSSSHILSKIKESLVNLDIETAQQNYNALVLVIRKIQDAMHKENVFKNARRVLAGIGVTPEQFIEMYDSIPYSKES